MSARSLPPTFRRGSKIQVGWDLQLIDGRWMRIVTREEFPNGQARLVFDNGDEFWVRRSSSYMTRFEPEGGVS